MIEFLWSPEPVGAIQQFFGASWSWFFELVTLLGAHEVVALVVALAFWIKGRQLAYAVLGIVVLAMAVDFTLWQIVGLPRPSRPEVIVHGKAPVSSFPSGHTVVATCVWGLLVCRTAFPKIATVLVVPAVMLSRLYLGMHYLGDVLGGLLLGLLLLRAHAHLWPVITTWLGRKPFAFYMALGLALPLAVLPFTFVLDSPRVWVAFGSALGAGIGLPLEYRYVHYAPVDWLGSYGMLKAVTGLGVLALLVFIQSAFGTGNLVLEVALFTLGAFWLVLGAPAVFTYLGLSAPKRATR